MKNAIAFFSISLAFMKPEISATFLSDKVKFLGFLPDITQVNFLKLLFYFTSHEKSQNNKFLEFFQLFAAFIEIEKSTFFRLSSFALLD